MIRIQELQNAHVKKMIKEVLIIRPLTIEQIVRLVCQKTMPNITPSRTEKEKIESLTAELIFDGHLNSHNGKIELNIRYRVSSVEEDYKLEDTTEPQHNIFIDGANAFETVGSERYPFIWQSLEPNARLQVELIAEPTNTRDALAVAVCIKKKPYAYLPRPEAAKYHPIIMDAKNKGYAVFANAEVQISESVLHHKIFILKLDTPENITINIT